jgi:hypothetical protein
MSAGSGDRLMRPENIGTCGAKPFIDRAGSCRVKAGNARAIMSKAWVPAQPSGFTTRASTLADNDVSFGSISTQQTCRRAAAWSAVGMRTPIPFSGFNRLALRVDEAESAGGPMLRTEADQGFGCLYLVSGRLWLRWERRCPASTLPADGVDHEPHRSRRIAVARVVRVEARERLASVIHHPAEATILHVRLRHVLRKKRQPVPT